MIIPALHRGPRQTINELSLLIEAREDAAFMLIGSSLGGYYATYLAEEYGLPAALINPAVRPFEFWETHIGQHKNYYTDDIHVVTGKHIEELRQLEKSSLTTPENFRVYLQTGDETLDYRRALEKYSSRHCVVRENGSHSYENYGAELPGIFDFLLSRIAESAR